jgi:hypothetical protein
MSASSERHQSSPEVCDRGANVGRLLAPGNHTRLPDRSVSGIVSMACCYPLQWRGRFGLAPNSVSRVRYQL